MDSPPFNPLLQVTHEAMIAVRESYDLDVKKINENLDAIEEWCKKQDHLVEASPYLRRDILERFLILGKGSVEKTKNIIERVLTVKGMLPEFIQLDPTILLQELNIFMDNALIVPLSKYNPSDNTRIFLYRLKNENFEDIEMLTLAKLGCFIIEMRMNIEYVFSDRLIFDFKHVKASLIKKLNPVIMKKLETMFMDAYKVRLKGVHIINAPSFINTVINIFKQIVREKIANRIYVHSSYEDLYKEIPKEVLPKEYGGYLESCVELTEKWKNYLKTDDAKCIIENGSKMISNEAKRSSVKFNEEYMGMPGSFKRLSVD